MDLLIAVQARQEAFEPTGAGTERFSEDYSPTDAEQYLQGALGSRSK